MALDICILQFFECSSKKSNIEIVTTREAIGKNNTNNTSKQNLRNKKLLFIFARKQCNAAYLTHNSYLFILLMEFVGSSINDGLHEGHIIQISSRV